MSDRPKIVGVNNLEATWFTKEVLEEVLQKKYSNDSLRVLKFIVTNFDKGENLVSDIKRVSVEYESNGKIKSGFFFLKSCYETDEFMMNLVTPYNVVNQEIRMYDEILPKLTRILQKATQDSSLFPENIAVFREKGSILFEDLSKRDFAVADRLKGLNVQETKLALQKIAKMHAASAVLNEKEPNIFENCDRGLFNGHTRGFEPYVRGAAEKCGEMVLQWEGLEYIGEKILKLEPHIMDYGERAYHPDPNQLNVLCHGDFWTNNILYKYENGSGSGNASDCIFIDFQFSCWGSPAIDIFYLFNTSLEESVYEKVDELIEFYHSELDEGLRALEFHGKIPSLAEFQRQLKLKGFINFSASICSLPLMINTDPTDACFYAMLENDEIGKNFKTRLFQNPLLKKILRKRFPIFDKMGLLDLKN